MASTMFDSVLYRDVFSTPAMRAVFSDEAQLKAYVQAEVALAVAQGEAGVIPREAAEAIAQQAPAIALDREQLKRDTEKSAIPSSGWCASSRSSSAKPAAMCIGGRPPRTSWTRRRCCNCAKRWR